MRQILDEFKIPFFLMENLFVQFIFIDNYFKFKEIEYLIHYVKF